MTRLILTLVLLACAATGTNARYMKGSKGRKGSKGSKASKWRHHRSGPIQLVPIQPPPPPPPAVPYIGGDKSNSDNNDPTVAKSLNSSNGSSNSSKSSQVLLFIGAVVGLALVALLVTLHTRRRKTATQEAEPPAFEYEHDQVEPVHVELASEWRHQTSPPLEIVTPTSALTHDNRETRKCSERVDEILSRRFQFHLPPVQPKVGRRSVEL